MFRRRGLESFAPIKGKTFRKRGLERHDEYNVLTEGVNIEANLKTNKVIKS